MKDNLKTLEEQSRKYSLNLSPRYASNWGAWEVAREFVCNAIDASESDMVLGGDGPDHLTIFTPTTPNLAELFMIGEGTKAAGGTTIGQFGEGAKIAALVATRTSGCSIAIHVPGYSVRFGFEDVLGAPCLHAYIDPSDAEIGGCLIDLRMPGIARATYGRILSDRTDGPVGKAECGCCRIYCKGVWIQDLQLPAAYDWNLGALDINRDRGMVNQWTIASRLSDWLDRNLTSEIADTIVQQAKGLETEALQFCVPSVNPRLKDAFHRVYGENAVIASDERAVNDKARVLGCEPHRVSKECAKRLLLVGCKTADSVLDADHQFEAVDATRYAAAIEDLRRFDGLIGAPRVTVCVFTGSPVQNLGYANLKDNRLWLSERLFAKGSEAELTMTYLHEMAHFISGQGDLTHEFEFTLTHMLGTLAMIVREHL